MATDAFIHVVPPLTTNRSAMAVAAVRLGRGCPLFFLSFLNYFEPMAVDKRIVFRRIKDVFREEIMENRISQYEDEDSEREDRRREPQPIGAILAELLAQYQIRFPEVRIAVVETPAVAV